MGLASGVAVLEFPSDNSPTVLVEVHTRNMLSDKPSIGVLRTFHEITHRCTLIPRCWTATGQWELQVTLALDRLLTPALLKMRVTDSSEV